MLVADICQSTRLYDTAGDADAYRLIARSISVLTDIIVKHDGAVIKTMGDGILSTFPDADSAFKAAGEMQPAQNETEIQVRVGINYGSVVKQGHDVFGDSVNVASHLLTHAKPTEIVLTGELVQHLSATFRSRTQLFDRASLKGKSAETDFYRVASGGLDETMILDVATVQAIGLPKLTLSYQGREVVIAEGDGDFSIGREADRDLVVQGPLVSRWHATIKAQRGNFHLVDHSANGTYVIYDGERPTLVKRQEARLHSAGLISLSPTADRDAEGVIECRCGPVNPDASRAN